MAQRDIKFVSPDTPSRCTWKLGVPPSSTPHTVVPTVPRPKVMPNILHAIGNSPLVKLNKIPQSMGIKCDMYAKCEFLNPGGSVKDRIGHRMIEDAEKKGLLKPGSVIIEPTSGNTGIGLAMASAIKGYRCVIVMPEKMSDEKVNALKALGAEIIRTPTEAAFDSPDSLISVAHRLNKEIPNSIVLDQYRNAGNPLAHYDGTATEILDAFDGKVDMVIIGAGTGGTIAGIGRKFKELCPTCTIVGADPEGSILAVPEELNKSDVNFYEMEGIGYDFIPTVLDRSVVDKWVKCNDKKSLPMARRLIREEGLLCGGSSGAAMMVGLEAAKSLKEGQKCVIILPDGVRNYMTKFISDSWMETRNLKETEDEDFWWWKSKVSALKMAPSQTISLSTSCLEAFNVMKTGKDSQLTVLDATGSIKGMVTMNNLMNSLTNKKVVFSDAVEKILVKQFRKVDIETSLGKTSRILEKEPFVVVTKSNSGAETFVGVLSNSDILNFMERIEFF
ncbi:cystathionine beta-synthase [Arctopsyche grandis]|uniref:cystathionine beta-synthase n=1 Tax=Arctopsyche grandis TaxID=121162 RepID=UPI00406D65FF